MANGMKNIVELIQERHSVRQYKKQELSEEVKKQINNYLKDLKEESGLDIRLVEQSKKVFGSLLLKIVGWRNPPTSYFVFVGSKTPETEEKCGYYGEKLVLFAQSIGLNTCWVGLFNKKEVKSSVKDTPIITIAVGYGENSGTERNTKSVEEVSKYDGEAPDWFTNGVISGLLAPTAMNKQGFFISGKGNKVSITCNNGSYTYIDLGIVKYHFEVGANKQNFEWEEQKA